MTIASQLPPRQPPLNATTAYSLHRLLPPQIPQPHIDRHLRRSVNWLPSADVATPRQRGQENDLRHREDVDSQTVAWGGVQGHGEPTSDVANPSTNTTSTAHDLHAMNEDTNDDPLSHSPHALFVSLNGSGCTRGPGILNDRTFTRSRFMNERTVVHSFICMRFPGTRRFELYERCISYLSLSFMYVGTDPMDKTS